MSDDLNRSRSPGSAARLSSRARHGLAGALLIALLTAAAPAAAECPPKQAEPRIPPASEPFIVDKSVINIDILKSQLIEYKEGMDGKPEPLWSCAKHSRG
jgi:hypothetical protein